MYCQSNALFRYVSKLSGIYPIDPLEALKCDMIGDQLEDCFSNLIPTFHIKELDEKVRSREELFGKGGSIYKKLLVLENWIEGPFCSGKVLNSADIQLYGFIKFLESGFLDGVPTNYFDRFSKLRILYNNVSEDEEIIKYYEN